MKQKPIIPYWVLYTALGALISIFISYEVYNLKSNATSLMEFVITAVGLVVSFTAFIIAMKTYLSIDSVNVITQMEGNVLENENYVTPFTMLIREYDAENSKSVSNAVFDHLYPLFERNSKTAIDFAKNLQYFIDIIVFFPYLFNPGDENRQENIEKMTKLLNLVDKRMKALNSVSTGNLILIEETIKLIKSITDYQKLEIKDTFNILDVRGTMLKNAVTQTVYYNYLGLFYNQKANTILRKKYGLGNVDFFSIDGLKLVKMSVIQLSSEDRELFTLYLKEAKKAFQQALEHRHSDMMWEGFIKFNEARSTYFLQLVGITEERNWQTIMNEGLVARSRLNILVKDIIDKEGNTTYLQEALLFENYLAGLVKMNILIAEGENITDTFDRTKYEAPHYDGILEDVLLHPYTGNFNKVRDYQESITDWVQGDGSFAPQ